MAEEVDACFGAGGHVSVGPGLARLAGVRVPIMQLRTTVSRAVYDAFPLFARAARAAAAPAGGGRFTGVLEHDGERHPVTMQVSRGPALLLEAGPAAATDDGRRTP